MRMITLGRTGANVSAVGLGCGGASRLGLATGGDLAHACGLVRRALDLGVTFIDTAHGYGTEEAVGQALKGRRDEVFLSTKTVPERGGRLMTASEYGAAVEDSLRRLQTDRIDLYHLHAVTLAQYDHCVETLLPELKRQQGLGKIGFLGVTERYRADTGHQMLGRALKDDHFDVVMAGFSLLNPSARQRVFAKTTERGVGALAMRVVGRLLSDPGALRQTVEGLLERGELDPHLIDASNPLGFLQESPDAASVVEAAYRFAGHEPGVDVVLTGTGNPVHLEANIAAILAPPLPVEALDRLARVFGRLDCLSGD